LHSLWNLASAKSSPKKYDFNPAYFLRQHPTHRSNESHLVDECLREPSCSLDHKTPYTLEELLS
jgi:hypothetical protein